MHPTDVILIAGTGLRTRPLRAVLSALGIAIGIAAMVAVLGVSASSRAELDRTLARLGTNLLTVTSGERLLSPEPATLPTEATSMIRRIPPVTLAAAAGIVPNVAVYRNDRVPTQQTGAIAVVAADLGLLTAVGGVVAHGTWLNPATARFPVTVLGSVAALRLGVAAPGPQAQVWLGGEWFSVAGILEPVPLARELDAAALVGWPAAHDYLGFDEHPTTIYCRVREDQVTAVRAVLAATANPQHPLEVQVSRPSDALAAKQVTNRTFTTLLLGLGAVALLVGGIGVANTIIISVLERRAEVGLRRALGATRHHIAHQFLTESLLLSALGGTVGVLTGMGVTAGYAALRHWPTVIPAEAIAGGLAATLVVGAVAGLYPAVRAARQPPTAALAG
jgi:putative ABC transport system permease protein